MQTDRREGLDLEPLEESDFSKQLKERQYQERTAHRIKREKLYAAARVRIRFLYHPPRGHWEGYLHLEGAH